MLLSFRFRLFAAISLVSLVCLALAAYVLNQGRHQALATIVQQQLQMIPDRTTIGFKFAKVGQRRFFKLSDRDPLQRWLASLRGLPQEPVVRLFFVDSQQRLWPLKARGKNLQFHTAEPVKTGARSLDLGKLTQTLHTPRVFDLAEVGKWLGRTLPLAGADQSLLLAVKLPDRSWLAAFNDMSRQWGLLAVIGALLGLLYLTAHWLTQPVRKLAALACELGQGKLDIQIPYRRRDEIGLLATSLRVMAESLRISHARLKDHSMALEDQVRDQTEKLAADRTYLNLVLESIHDGLVVIDSDFKILPGTSLKSHEILEVDSLEGQDFFDILFSYDQEHQKERELLFNTLSTAFNLFIPDQFDDIMNALPRHMKINFRHGARLLEFNFAAIVEQDAISKIIVTFSNETEKYAHRNVGSYAHHKAIGFVEQLQVLSQGDSKRLALSDFLNESFLTVHKVHLAFEKSDYLDANAIFRQLHTVKGNARTLNLESVAYLAHELESLVQKLRDEPDEFTVEDHEEARTHCKYLLRGLAASKFILRANLDDEQEFSSRWDAYCSSTTEGVCQLAEELGKQVQVEWDIAAEMGHEDFTLFKRVIGHMLRNAVDHGIEEPEARRSQNKSATGHIEVGVSYQSGWWQVIVKDDGSGIDREQLLQRAKRKNLLGSHVEELQDDDVIMVLCHPGVSSREEVTEVSGRGVGLDAVAREVRVLGGDLALVQSSRQGTTFRISWPVHQQHQALSA
jgi:signal transduction histidine kinase